MIRTLVTALAATLALGAASAQQMDTAKAVERLRAADANGDGALTKAEFAAYRAQQFQRLDRNGDGYLTDADTQQLKAPQRDELMERAWDDPAAAFDRTVDAHVKTLRAKLRAVAPDADPIVTHRGMGYALREDA